MLIVLSMAPLNSAWRCSCCFVILQCRCCCVYFLALFVVVVGSGKEGLHVLNRSSNCGSGGIFAFVVVEDGGWPAMTCRDAGRTTPQHWEEEDGCS